jgi:mannose-6-phosphate isomerase-like protein (cupin superfamily)
MELVFKKLTIPKVETSKFTMNPIELKDYIDYEPKRIYYVTEPNSDTSAHCHKTEKELFVMVAGSCIAEVDYGHGIEEVPLHSPSDAIYVGNYVWHHFKQFTPGSILMAVSSTNYQPDRSDYVEDYQQYQELVKQLIADNA